MAVLKSNTTSQPTTLTIKCPVFTRSGYDVDNKQYYCDYESWAYGVFAIVGVLLIMVPLVSVICCIARYKDRKRYTRRLRSTASIDSYVTSSEQPLLHEQTDHENAIYGTIENFSHNKRSPTFDGRSERQSESHDDISVVSSRASLMPNYDQASLDLKNSNAANLSSNPQNNTVPTEGPDGLLNSDNVVSPYASCNIIPNSNSSRNIPISPIYVVPEENSPTSLQSLKNASYLAPVSEPVYNVLENPNTIENKLDQSSNTNEKQDNASDLEPVYNVLENPNTIENKPDQSSNTNEEQDNASGLTDTPKKNEETLDEGVSKDSGLNILDTPNSEPIDNILEPTMANIPVTDKSDEELLENQSLRSKDNTGDDSFKPNERTDATEEPRYMPLIFPEEKSGNASKDKSADNTDPSDSRISKERTKSRADYQELLLDAINNYPADERNGCFVVRDSISSPGSKALTVYHKTADCEQEFYNFKVCFDEAGQVYLAKSTQRFPTIEKLLEYLKIHTDMLPCTLKKQIM